MRTYRAHSSGFTLIELSIVLVIVALMVGSILVGRDMIRQYQIRKLFAATTEFSTKFNAFKMKYDAIPGELPTFIRFFPNMTGYCTGGSVNGLIEDVYEMEALFTELWMAGLVEVGRKQVDQGGVVRAGYNCFQNNMEDYAGYSTSLDNVYGTVIAIANRNAMIFGGAFVPILSPNELSGLDSKFDDGLSTSGIIRGYNTQTTCRSGTGYQATLSEDKSCYLTIQLQ